MFAFLEDALDDWPEKETVPRNFRKQVTESIQEETEQDENQGSQHFPSPKFQSRFFRARNGEPRER